MFVLTVSFILLMVYQSECGMTATAVLYGDNSMSSYGMLTFTQDSANTAVRITGTLRGLNISSAHVCLTSKTIFNKKFLFLGFSYSYNSCIRRFT